MWSQVSAELTAAVRGRQPINKIFIFAVQFLEKLHFSALAAAAAAAGGAITGSQKVVYKLVKLTHYKL